MISYWFYLAGSVCFVIGTSIVLIDNYKAAQPENSSAEYCVACDGAGDVFTPDGTVIYCDCIHADQLRQRRDAV